MWRTNKKSINKLKQILKILYFDLPSKQNSIFCHGKKKVTEKKENIKKKSRKNPAGDMCGSPQAQVEGKQNRV